MKYPRWIDDVEAALRKLGGTAHLSRIYLEVNEMRTKRNAPIGELNSWVRYILQQNSRGHGEDVFEPVHPIQERKGIWRLKRNVR